MALTMYDRYFHAVPLFSALTNSGFAMRLMHPSRFRTSRLLFSAPFIFLNYSKNQFFLLLHLRSYFAKTSLFQRRDDRKIFTFCRGFAIMQPLTHQKSGEKITNDYRTEQNGNEAHTPIDIQYVTAPSFFHVYAVHL